jgi:hypothetical protein
MRQPNGAERQLVAPELVKRYSALFGALKSIKAFTWSPHWIISCGSSVHPECKALSNTLQHALLYVEKLSTTDITPPHRGYWSTSCRNCLSNILAATGRIWTAAPYHGDKGLVWHDTRKQELLRFTGLNWKGDTCMLPCNGHRSGKGNNEF